MEPDKIKRFTELVAEEDEIDTEPEVSIVILAESMFEYGMIERFAEKCGLEVDQHNEHENGYTMYIRPEK